MDLIFLGARVTFGVSGLSGVVSVLLFSFSAVASCMFSNFVVGDLKLVAVKFCSN